MPLWFRFVSILIISLYFQCLITRLLTSTLNIKGLFPGALSEWSSSGNQLAVLSCRGLKRFHVEIHQT